MDEASSSPPETCSLPEPCYPLLHDAAAVLPPMDNVELGVRVVIHGVCGIAGVFLNAACIVVLVRTGLWRQWTYGMILNLSVSDLVFSSVMVLGLPGVVSGRWLYSDGMCRALWTLFAATLCVTSLSFMLTTVHRYVSIVRRHNGQHAAAIFSPRYLPALLATLWGVGIGGGMTLTIRGPTRALFWPDLCYVDNSDLYWVAMGFIGVFVTVPFLSVPFLYVRILTFIHSVAQPQGNNTSQRRGHRTAFMLFILFSTFSVAFVPYFIRGFVVRLLSFPALKQSFLATWLLLAGVSAVNPLLFITLFTPIRKGFLATFCPRCVKQDNKVHVFVTAT